MDKTSVVRRFQVLCIIAYAVFISACASSSAPNKNAVAVNKPAPLPPEAVKIEKPVNVSFSTYSTDWPVGWQWIDPDEKNNPTTKDVRKAVLRVRIPNGKDLYGSNVSAPRYVKPITGDFQIETRVKFLPKENYQGAGLLIYVDDRTYLRFERAYGGVGGGAEGIRIDFSEGGNYRPIVTPDDLPTSIEEVELRMVRAGKRFSAYWRENENEAWREAGAVETDFPPTIMAGLIACNTAREVVAEFGFIRLLPPEA